MLLNEVLDQFIISRRERCCRPQTIESYRKKLRWFAEWCAGHGLNSVGSITTMNLIDYVQSLDDAQTKYNHHPYREKINGKLSTASIAGQIQSIKTFFFWCWKRGIINTNPAETIKKRSYIPRPGKRTMRPETLLALYGAVENDRDRAMLAFMADTGCRRGEVCSLTVDNVDFHDLSCLVSGKTGERKVFFTQRTSNLMNKWLTTRSHKSIFVFTRFDSGVSLTAGGINEVFKRLARKCNAIGPASPHALRHLVGQTWTDKANLELARQKLGHKDIYTTARFYANQDEKRLKENTDKLALL